jgi:hypothetical protein
MCENKNGLLDELKVKDSELSKVKIELDGLKLENSLFKKRNEELMVKKVSENDSKSRTRKKVRHDQLVFMTMRALSHQDMK